MSFSNFSSYLAKKNGQPRWGCIKGDKGDTGPTGPSGEQGIPGADASGTPVENFVFGWTGISGNSGMTEGEQYWLIPGGQVDRRPYKVQAGAQPPSMAVAYKGATITAAAIHITSTVPSPSPTFDFTIYSFCKIDASGIPVTDVSGSGIIKEAKIGCNCQTLLPIKADCEKSLAVSVKPNWDTGGNSISLSISLFSNGPLTTP